MPNLKEILKEFVATANAGEYKTEGELLSAFPELSGYNSNTLKEFVATANAGQYTSEDELLAAFPEFGEPVKKKEESVPLWLQKQEQQQPKPKQEQTPPFLESKPSGISLGSQRVPETAPMFEAPPMRTAEEAQAIVEAPEDNSYVDNLYTNLGLGASMFNEAVFSLPETVINLFAVPQNYIAEKTGWNVGTNADKIKETLGITNPLLDWVNEDQKVLSGEVSNYIAKNYDDAGIASNFQSGNYKDGFELLGSSITQAVPISVAILLGGMVASTEVVAATSTLGLTEGQRQELEEMDPTMSESEKTLKALSMSAAESVFSSIGQGTIGKVYRDIAKREGKEAAKGIFKDGLVQTYKTALEKGGMAAGFVGEGIEEAATQITQNVISGRSAFENVADAFATGAGSGVVFTAPISAINAKNYIKNKAETYATKDKIGEVLKDKADNIGNLYNVPVGTEITPDQLEIANLNKSRVLLENNLKKNVKDGKITPDDAKQSLYVFDKIQQVSNSVKDLNVDKEDKAKIATLLSKRNDLANKIKNQDDVLVVQEKQQVEQINKQIEEILLKPKEDAIQEPSTEAIPNEISSLKDDENVVITVESIDQVPDQFKDRAQKRQGAPIEVRESILGLPIGKKTTKVVNEGYSYTLTGKETKDYAIQKSSPEESVLRPEESQVGLQEVGEGNVQAPAQEVIQEEVAVTTNEDLQAEFDSIETPEDTAPVDSILESTRAEVAKLQGEVDSFSESIGRSSEKIKASQVDRTRQDLGDNVIKAKRKISTAEDTDVAIEEFKQAEKERDAFEERIAKDSEFEKVNSLIYDEVEASKKDNYEHKELFDQDPRLAALQSAKDMVEFAKKYPDENIKTENYVNEIKILEEDIAKFPVKQAVSPATPVAEAAPKVSSKTQKAKTPKAKSVPIPVAIPKPAPAPAPKPVVVVSQPAPRVQGPEALQEEYKAKMLAVTLNEDKSRTPKQIEERKKELIAEYQKLKAEMTAPRPKAEPEAKAAPKVEAKPAPKKAAPAPKAEPVVSKKDQEEIKRLQDEIDYEERQIEEAKEELGNTKYNYEESKAEVKKKRDELKGKKMSKQEREDAKDELIAELNSAKDNYEDYLKQYNDQLSEAEKDKKKAEAKLAKLQAKQVEAKAEPTSVVEEEEPSYEDIQAIEEIYDIVDEDEDGDDFEPKPESFLKKSSKVLDNASNGINKFKRENLSMGLPIVTAEAIVKALKVLVKGGILLEEAIPRVAASMNITLKQVVAAIKELAAIGSTVKSLNNLRTQTKSEIQAAKEGARNVSDAIKAITDYFNFNAERGNLTRRDLGRVINAIAKVKDQKSLDKAADKIFAIIDKAETDVIEVSQSKALISQIKLEARAAIGAKKDINQKRKELSNTIKEMETTGKMSTAKAQTLINKISKVNLDNPASVDSFLDYVENVFENAAYEEELKDVKSKLSQMKNNISRVKVGTDEVLIPLLNRLASINPSFIPAELFESYKELIDMLGSSAAVLDLTKNISEITEQTKEILDQIDEQLSVIPELTTRLFNYDKAILTEDGALDYSKTLDKMQEDGAIDEEEKALMKKYKSLIMPKVVKIPKTEQELAAEKKVLIDEINKTSPSIAKSLKSNLERSDAEELIKLSKTNAAEMLTNKELEDLLGVFNNMENGFYLSYANQLLVKLRSNKRGSILAKTLEKIEIPSVINKKAKIMDKGKALYDRIEKGYLYYIDEMVNNFKTKDIYDSTLGPLAQGADPYKINVDRINKQIQDAKNKIVKHFGRRPNKFIESMRKMAIYRMEREWIENPSLRDSKVVNPAIDYINATVDAKKTKYGKRDKENLMKIANQYGIKNSEGKIVNIDMEKLYNSFSAPEKSALELFDKINNSLKDKAGFVSDITRGNKIYFHNAYNHLNVLSTDVNDADPIQEFQNRFNGTNIISTKGKSLIERTGGAKPVDFDIFSTVQRGAKFVLMDYHMTNPVRETRRTIRVAREVMKKDGKLTEDADQLLDMIEQSTENALQSMLSQSLIRDMPIDKAMKSVARAGVTSMLASTDKFAKEIISNTTWILLYGRKEWVKGSKIMKNEKPEDTLALAEASDSTMMSRVFGANPLGLKLIDPDLLYNQTGVSDDQLKGNFGNVMSTIYNYSLRPTQNAAVATASAILSTPDKRMMQPLWRGTYDAAFESITGQKIDVEKVKSKDADYMSKNKDAMRAAARQADSVAAAAGTVDNPFMKSLRAFTPENKSPMVKFLRRYNSFLTNFAVGEFLSARRGIHAAMGNGMISKEQGGWLLAATVARMASYQALSGLSLAALYGMLTGEDDEDDDKSILQKIGQSLANTFTTLMMGTEGNLIRSAASWGVEKVNEEYGDMLREGEYDPYEDAIQYTFMAPSSKGKQIDLLDVIINTSGPYSPVLKTTNLALKKMNEEPKKEASAIERSDDELMIRLPLEIIGNTGFLPFYKDIRNIVNKSIYKELDKEMKAQENKQEEFKPMGLNKSDLKRYYPEVYEEYYGEGTQDAAKRKLEYEKRILEQRIKDDYYNYVPKQKIQKGFGGKEFGSGSSKKGGGFGSKGFGK